ncbi:MAG: alpha/beta fold hydrolase [Cytophagales bacterium]|nr:MAG: alpha/beta fold hydrolase [Cytophagales bacterium]
MKILVYIFSILGICYTLVCIAVYWWQERLIFHPETLPDDFQFHFSTHFEEVYLQNENSENRLHGLWFKGKNSKSSQILLYFHGNAGSLQGWGQVAQDFVQKGYDVLVIDYRQYGKSRGILSEKQLLEDAKTAFEFLKKHYSEAQITLMGRSLGTGIAAYVATLGKVKRLILETPYYSFHALVGAHINFLPVGILLRYHLPTSVYLEKINCPVYIFHGTADAIIPLAQSERLKQQFPDIDLTVIENGNHNNLPSFAPYWQKMDTILRP